MPCPARTPALTIFCYLLLLHQISESWTLRAWWARLYSFSFVNKMLTTCCCLSCLFLPSPSAPPVKWWVTDRFLFQSHSFQNLITSVLSERIVSLQPTASHHPACARAHSRRWEGREVVLYISSLLEGGIICNLMSPSRCVRQKRASRVW